MADIIKTQSVSKNFVKTNGVLLEQTSDTALLFFPEIHPGGVRGHLVRFKKVRKQEWEKIPEEDFKQLKLYEGVHIELGTQQLIKLYEEIEKRKQISKTGVQDGYTEYVVADKNKALLVDDQNKKEILDQLLKKGCSDEFWKLIASSEPELADKLSAGHLQMHRRKILYEFKTRLTKTFSETKGADSWQIWIYSNNWLFGPNYREPIEKQKINISGVMPDYLFPTIDGFVDILEIKLPNDNVILADANHKGSWKWTPETNTAICQVVNYLSEIDRLRLEIEKNIKTEYECEVSLLKPRAFILIGNNEHWDSTQREGLRKLNHSLHGIEVITYFDLIQRGETFISSPLAGIKEKNAEIDDMPF